MVLHPRMAKAAAEYPELFELEQRCPPLGQILASCRQGRTCTAREEKVLFQTIGDRQLYRLLQDSTQYNDCRIEDTPYQKLNLSPFLFQSTLRGRWAGMVVTMGLCTGLIFHSSAVALGVAAIFQTSVVAFSLLKFVGAGYLVYLAWKAFRASAQEVSGDGSVGAVSGYPLKAGYFQGFLCG